MTDVIQTIEAQLSAHPVLLYMKGSPDQPMCGFSARAVQVLRQCGVPFTSVDVLSHPDIRQTLPVYAKWPTFPQLYVQGELVGGSDIMMDMFERGELQVLLNAHSQSK